MTSEKLAAAREGVEALVAENLALRCMLGGGCDANNDGLHTIIKQGRDEFCTECGEMTRNGKSKPWFNEDRLERTLARIAASLRTTTAKDD